MKKKYRFEFTMEEIETIQAGLNAALIVGDELNCQVFSTRDIDLEGKRRTLAKKIIIQLDEGEGTDP